MNPQHVIYLTGSGVVLYTWDRRSFVPVAGHALPDGDPAPLLEYLKQMPSSTIMILVDVLDEEHVRDQISPLGRSDQAKLLARKLARQFPKTDYRTTIVQGPTAGDRKLRQVLFSALTRPEQLSKLQARLAAARLPVAGVATPALFSRMLIERLGPAKPADATLLVSRQREGGLRISFCRGRDLAGSRLIRPGVAAAPGDYPHLLQQLEESVRYFDAAFVPGAGNPVDVILLCEPAGSAPFEATLQEGFRLHVPDPAEAARKLKLHNPLQPGNADLLFVELLRHHAPAGNFAPAMDRRYFRLHQINVIGRAACVTLAAAGLLGAGLNGVAALRIHQDRRDLGRATADVAQLLQDAGETVPTSVDPLAMQRTVGTVQALERHAVAPAAVLSLVSTALDRHPDIQLDEIQWAPVDQPATVAAADDDGTAGDNDTDTDGAGATGNAPSRVRLRIRAHVAPFDGNYPRAFAEMQTFMATLRHSPRVTAVTATSKPLDIDPHSTLTGEASAATRNESAAFSLDVMLGMNDDRA